MSDLSIDAALAVVVNRGAAIKTADQARPTRALTRAAELQALKERVMRLHGDLLSWGKELDGWASLIAELYHRVPEARERIDRHLGRLPKKDLPK
jgi:hypothetical protein